jgi:excisionase family DNA binding protein
VPRRATEAVSERLLTAREVAELLSVKAGTVLAWLEAGDLPGFRLGGRENEASRRKKSAGGPSHA